MQLLKPGAQSLSSCANEIGLVVNASVPKGIHLVTKGIHLVTEPFISVTKEHL